MGKQQDVHIDYNTLETPDLFFQSAEPRGYVVVHSHPSGSLAHILHPIQYRSLKDLVLNTALQAAGRAGDETALVDLKDVLNRRLPDKKVTWDATGWTYTPLYGNVHAHILDHYFEDEKAAQDG